MNRTRFYYLDLLRVFLTMLVFYHHSAVAFGASGGWYYIEGNNYRPNSRLALSIYGH